MLVGFEAHMDDAHELAQIEFWTEEEARRVLAARRRGESYAAFAVRIGATKSRITYWARKLKAAPAAAPAIGKRSRERRRGRGGGAAAPARQRGHAIELVPVTVVAPRPVVISIALRNGRVVRIEGDMDDAMLERAIVAAERAGC